MKCLAVFVAVLCLVAPRVSAEEDPTHHALELLFGHCEGDNLGGEAAACATGSVPLAAATAMLELAFGDRTPCVTITDISNELTLPLPWSEDDLIQAAPLIIGAAATNCSASYNNGFAGLPLGAVANSDIVTLYQSLDLEATKQLPFPAGADAHAHEEEGHAEEEGHDDHDEERGNCLPVAELYEAYELNTTDVISDAALFANMSVVILNALVSEQCLVLKPQNPEQFLDHIFSTYAASGDSMTLIEFEELMESLSLTASEASHDGHGHRRRRAVSSECHSAEELMLIYGVAPPLTKAEFEPIAVALLDMINSNACAGSASSSSSSSDAEKWGYGFLATAIVCLASIASILILPYITTPDNGNNKSTDAELRPVTDLDEAVPSRGHSFRLNKTAGSFLFALAVGTLVGDVVLHLLPQVWGLHAHDEEGHDHSAEEEDAYDFIWKGLVVLVGLYGFYLFEVFAHLLFKHNHHTAPSSGEPVSHTHTHPSAHENGSLPWLVIFGDALHNFVDGLAIGAAFSISVSQGISISIAVLAHELPHEFADFGILLEAGFSVKKAVMWNLGSACTAFVGLFIGLEASTGDANVWILSITAGMFLYLALTDLLPELLSILADSPRAKFLRLFSAQQIGIWFGFAVMIVLARYEERIDV